MFNRECAADVIAIPVAQLSDLGAAELGYAIS
jgi:hypothetical protein